ncbi:hypothetical protein NBRC116494_07230 [Aurantivibrio plasticivorans]
MRDSYERFFSEGYIDKDQFFDFGLRETIYAPKDKAKEGWEQLKQRIVNNEPVFMRGFGRNSNGSHLFQEFYRLAFSNDNVKIDPTNNKEPTLVIRDMTGYSKTKSAKYEPIRNYQVSHIFGRTKNIFAFTAPWNIVYLPKMIDPFTGHEAKGDLIDEYQMMFQKQSFAYFEPLIDDYNQLILGSSLQARIDEGLNGLRNNNAFSDSDIDKLIKSVREELTPILI